MTSPDDGPLSPLPTGAETRAPLPSRLESLAGTARDNAKAAASENTHRAYAADWRHYAGWARRHGLAALPPHP